jgi:hypothetical protein
LQDAQRGEHQGWRPPEATEGDSHYARRSANLPEAHDTPQEREPRENSRLSLAQLESSTNGVPERAPASCAAPLGPGERLGVDVGRPARSSWDPEGRLFARDGRVLVVGVALGRGGGRLERSPAA